MKSRAGHLELGYSRREALTLGLCLAGCAAFPGAASAAERALRWGSSSLGSTGYVIIEALAQTVNRHTSLKNSTIATAGGAENMALISSGELELGQSTSSDWPPATKGEKPFKAPVKAHQILSYTVWPIPLIVHADSRIEKLEDLAGRRVMPSQAGSATAIMYHTILKAAGVDRQVNWTYGSWNETYGAFKSRAVDAVPAVLTNGRPSPQVTEVVTSTKVRVIAAPEAVLKKAKELNSGILWGDVTPEQWNVLSERRTLPAISGVLAAHPALPPETAYTIVKAIYDNAAEVRKVGVQLEDIRLDFATRFLMEEYPVNPGAARYFKEKGVWRNELKVAG